MRLCGGSAVRSSENCTFRGAVSFCIILCIRSLSAIQSLLFLLVSKRYVAANANKRIVKTRSTMVPDLLWDSTAYDASTRLSDWCNEVHGPAITTIATPLLLKPWTRAAATQQVREETEAT
jgi:hypothetical protein